MTDGTVLWYVHDHGLGHLQRVRATLPMLPSPVIVAGGPGIADAARDLLDAPFVALPADFTDADEPTRPPFHHAPAGPATRARFAALAELVREHRCTTAVVDVSVETAVWARLSGLRVVVIRQSGRRSDPGHRLAWSSADAVVVPQVEQLEPITQAERQASERWHFTGMFSRWDHHPASGLDALSTATRTCLVLPGAGGTTFPADFWTHRAPPPGWKVTVAGLGAATRPADGVSAPGHVDNLWPLLSQADLVLASAGWGAVADAAAARAPLAVVAEDRPYDEQQVRARALADHDLALRLPRWPMPDSLGSLLSRVRRRLGSRSDIAARWARVHDRCGARRMAAVVNRVHAR